MADEIKNVEGEAAVQGNFIWDFIKEDTAEGGKFEGKKVHTRFPPEQTTERLSSHRSCKGSLH